MSNSIHEICKYLNCEASELASRLENPFFRATVDNFLQGHDLYVMYKEAVDPINYHSLSTKDAKQHVAYGGFKDGMNVDQHFYARYRINLQYPKLKCVLEPRGRGFSYYPLEVLYLKPKQNVYSQVMDYFNPQTRHDQWYTPPTNTPPAYQPAGLSSGYQPAGAAYQAPMPSVYYR